MGGVDRMDQARAYYKVGRKSIKYWKYILYNVYNIAVINSFIVYKKLNIQKNYKLRHFIRRLVL